MFGQNEIVGLKYFKDAPPDSLMVTSRFYTLQGEGPYRGEPAYFIRLTKCNLACSFCDTFFDAGEYKTYEELFTESDKVIEEFYRTRNLDTPDWAQGLDKKIGLVITGGEPTLQSNLVEFLNQAKKYFKWCQIESNGILARPLGEHVTYVVSPKCLEKDHKAVKYLEPNPMMLERASCLKFVMSADQDSPYSKVPDWALDWREKTGKPIFISPMNIYNKMPEKAKNLRASGQNDISIKERSTVDEIISAWEPGLLDMVKNQANHQYTAEYCMKIGATFQMQVHLWANLA